MAERWEAQARGAAASRGRRGHVLFLDLDRFSRFNKVRGQEAGDDALRTVAEVLRQNLRDGDSCFRRGGEEFVVLLPSTGRAPARAVAERLRAAVEAASIPHGGHPDSSMLTVTIVFAEVGAHVAEAVERAALRAFQAKDSRNRNVVLSLSEEDQGTGRDD